MTRKTAPTTKHDLKVSYGNKVVQTKVSLGYEYTEALYEGRDYQRLTARVNNNFKADGALIFDFSLPLFCLLCGDEDDAGCRTCSVYEGRDYQRLTARVNNNFKVTKWLQFGLDAYYRRGITRQPQTNPLAATLYMTPLDPAVNSNGTYAAGHNSSNPWATMNEGGRNNQWTDRLGAKLSVIITPFEGLSKTTPLHQMLLPMGLSLPHNPHNLS